MAITLEEFDTIMDNLERASVAIIRTELRALLIRRRLAILDARAQLSRTPPPDLLERIKFVEEDTDGLAEVLGK